MRRCAPLFPARVAGCHWQPVDLERRPPVVGSLQELLACCCSSGECRIYLRIGIFLQLRETSSQQRSFSCCNINAGKIGRFAVISPVFLAAVITTQAVVQVQARSPAAKARSNHAPCFFARTTNAAEVSAQFAAFDRAVSVRYPAPVQSQTYRLLFLGAILANVTPSRQQQHSSGLQDFVFTADSVSGCRRGQRDSAAHRYGVRANGTSLAIKAAGMSFSTPVERVNSAKQAVLPSKAPAPQSFSRYRIAAAAAPVIAQNVPANIRVDRWPGSLPASAVP